MKPVTRIAAAVALAGLLLVGACDEEPELTEETYAAMTVELVRAGFIGPEADAVYESHDVSPELYDRYSKELEKDPDRQRRVGELIKEELGEDWEDWGRAFGEAFAKLGYNFGEIAVEFGAGFIEGFMNAVPEMEAAFEEMAESLEETFSGLEAEIEAELEENQTGDAMDTTEDET